MPDESSNSALRGDLAPLLPREVLRSLVPFNFVPALHLLLCAAMPIACTESAATGITVSLACLYLLPPLAARALLSLRPLATGLLPVEGPDFRTWWILSQLQMVFCRVPLLEELLRLVPGLYSMWLRMWGSKIGSFVFWGAGTTVLDRTLLEIGDRVATGAGVRLNPHVLQRSEEGSFVLALAPVRIGSDSLVGGYSLITAGGMIPAGSVTHAYLLLPPFTEWRGEEVRKGKRRVPRWGND